MSLKPYKDHLRKRMDVYQENAVSSGIACPLDQMELRTTRAAMEAINGGMDMAYANEPRWFWGVCPNGHVWRI